MNQKMVTLLLLGIFFMSGMSLVSAKLHLVSSEAWWQNIENSITDAERNNLTGTLRHILVE